MKKLLVTGALVALVGVLASSARAASEPARTAIFALIVGVNRSVDADLKPLRYADDDAVRYQELFRNLGAKTLLLASLDQDTSALSPQAVAEAMPPTRAFLNKAVAVLATEIALARARGVKTSFYLLYAGHGNVDEQHAYITLEDARLDGPTIGREILDTIKADENHLIVDACYSFFLVSGRGPGGERRALQGFSALSDLGRRKGLGLLLSTSTGNESHEWGGFQAGVFSHEVRSGLYGAADFDGDGRISYGEMSAFLTRANQAVINEKYRPAVFARAPKALIWGGTDGSKNSLGDESFFSDGGIYDPATDTWKSMSKDGAPNLRIGPQDAFWDSGEGKAYFWGELTQPNGESNSFMWFYDVDADRWASFDLSGLPPQGWMFVWTGKELLAMGMIRGSNPMTVAGYHYQP